MDASSIPESEKPFAREGYAIMGAAFEVHKELGGGLLEDIYQEALELELTNRSIPFASKEQLQTFYKGQSLKKSYEPDLPGHGQIVIELKAMAHLGSAQDAQLINYLRLAQKPVGYLINFAPIKEVQWERFVLTQFLKN